MENGDSAMTDFKREGSHLSSYPPVEKWDDWVEYDPAAWPRRVKKHYQLVPTICFNCESACGLLAYVDKETGQIAKFEGNPKHPASRGRLCAKGPATITQIHDPDRILYPMKRSGPRGGGKWTRTSWDEVLETFGARIRKAFQENRGEEVMYHVGRPGHDFIMDRTCKPGASTATTRTRMFVRLRRASVTCSGTMPIVLLPTTPTRALFCSFPRISSRGTISIRMRSALSKEKWRAQNSPSWIRDCRIQPAWRITGCRAIPEPKRRYCWRWRWSSSVKIASTRNLSRTGPTGKNSKSMAFLPKAKVSKR